MAGNVWTIGHWTCPEDVFVGTLKTAGIQTVVDVRAHPGSRRNPQFGTEAMVGWLGEAGIGYQHLAALGGRRARQAVDPDINAGWQNQSFKNYADYTLTPEFEEGLERLTALASERRVAIMCGEPMPWRCHRLLISNTLATRGWTVTHLRDGADPTGHELGRWGASPVIDDSGPLPVVTYPAEAGPH